MKNFYTALMTKFTATSGGSHNDFYQSVNGRLFNTVAPDGAELPYCVFTHVSSVPDNTFSEDIDDVLIQFSIFSASGDETEALNAMENLKALYDDCTLSISSATLVQFTRGPEGLEIEDDDTPSGTQKYWHYHVDYNAVVRKG
jgi:hypothetical protein